MKKLKKIALLFMLNSLVVSSTIMSMHKKYSAHITDQEFLDKVEEFLNVIKTGDVLPMYSRDQLIQMKTLCNKIKEELKISQVKIKKALTVISSHNKAIRFKDTTILDSFVCPVTGQNIQVTESFFDDHVSALPSEGSINLMKPIDKKSGKLRVVAPIQEIEAQVSPATVTANYSPSNLSLSERRSGRQSNIPAGRVEYFQSLQKRRRIENSVE